MIVRFGTRAAERRCTLSQSVRKFATFRERNLQHAETILIDEPPYFRRKPMYTVADVSVITGLGDDFIIRNFHRYGPVREEFSHKPGRRRKRRFFLVPHDTLLAFLERNSMSNPAGR
jgi:hypothetical protein